MSRIYDSDCGDSCGDTSHLNLEWDSISPTSAVASGITGMTGKCLQVTSAAFSGNDSFNRRNLGDYNSRLICGFRLRMESLPVSGYQYMFGFWDTGFIQTIAMVDSSGAISFWTGYSAAFNSVGSRIALSPAGTVRPGVNIHIALDVTCGSSGSIVVYANSQVILSTTGATNSYSSSGFNQVSLHSGYAGNGGSYTIYYDDLWVNNTSGSKSTGFDGDLKGISSTPSAAGQYSEQSITGSAPAATNYGSVNETPPNDGATMVEATSVGLRDTYKVPTLPANVVTIVSVTTLVDARTDTAGLGAGAQIAPMIGDGTTTVTGTAVSLNTDFDYKRQYWPQNPITSANWTVAGWNAGIEFGHKRIA